MDMKHRAGAVLLASAYVVFAPRPAHAQPSWSALSGPLEQAGFRLLAPPAVRLELGGLVIPGHERAGSSLRMQVISSVPGWSESASEITLSQPVALGTVAELARSLGRAGDQLARDASACAGSVVETSSLAVRSATTNAMRSPDGDVFTAVAKKVGADRAALDGAVIVWAVATPRPQMPSCYTDAARQAVEAAFRDVAVGYKAGVPRTMSPGRGGASNPILEVLKIFDLSNLARERTVRVKSIATTPGGHVAYMGRLQALGRLPDTLPDAEFQQVGDSPTGPLDLWTGRFFVRVTVGDKRSTIIRDINRTDRDRVIQITVPPARH